MAHPYQETGSGVLYGYYRTGNKKVSREYVSRLLGIPSFERAIRREDWDRVAADRDEARVWHAIGDATKTSRACGSQQ